MFHHRMIATGLFLGICSSAVACIHPPATYKGSLAETGQEALIFWRGGREELVLKVAYKATTASALPETLAWVVPVPSRPDHYGVESPDLFADAFNLTEPLIPNGSRGLGASHKSVATVVDQVTVGEYEIKALQARGGGAADALNGWLAAHGFKTVPLANMKYYTDRGWTFLAIKINKNNGDPTLAAKGMFHPLRIAFKADKIYYPLKFSSHQGTFHVTAYVFTERPVAQPEWLYRRTRGLEVMTFDRASRSMGSTLLNSLPVSLWPADQGAAGATRARPMGSFESLPEPAPSAPPFPNPIRFHTFFQSLENNYLGQFATTYCTVVEGTVNGKDNHLADWNSDFILEEAAAK